MEVLIIKTKNERKKIDVEEMVARAKYGDKAALGELLDRYKGFIMKQASRFRIPSYDYEDVVQHGYLTVIRCIQLYKSNTNKFDQYVMNAVKNNMGYLLRGNIKHYREVPDETGGNKPIDTSLLTVEEHVIAYDEVKKLREVMEMLTQEEQDLLRDVYFREVNMTEYAKEKGLKYHQLIFKKNSTLKKLRKKLKV